MRNTATTAPPLDTAVITHTCPDCTGSPSARTVHLLDLSSDNRAGYATICNGCSRVIDWSIQDAAA